MDKLLNFLNHGWVGAVIGVVGLVFGIYQLFRRSGPKLAYQYVGQRLIDDGEGLLPGNVVIQYDGKPVKRLSLSQIIVWNAGDQAVRQADIVNSDPIRFSFDDDAEILSVEIEKTTRAANECMVEPLPNRRGGFFYRFAFLDRNDGVLIRVLHTGSITRPDCLGTVIGLPKGIQSLGRIPVQFNKRRFARLGAKDDVRRSMLIAVTFILRNSKVVFFATGLLGIGALILAAFPSLALLAGTSISDNDRVALAIGGFVYGPMGFLTVWVDRRRFPSSLLPEELSDERDDQLK